MTNALKMAKLDFFSIKSQRLIIVSIFIIVFISIMSGNAMVGYLSSAWLTTMFSSVVFAVQEKNNLEKLYGTLSLKQNDIVAGRYIFMLSFFVAAFFIGLLTSFCVNLFKRETFDFMGIFSGFGISLLCFSLIAGIQTPIFFKIGYMKARVWSMIPFILLMLVALLPSFTNGLTGVISYIGNNTLLFTLCGILGSILITCVSYYLSVLAYKKRK